MANRRSRAVLGGLLVGAGTTLTNRHEDRRQEEIRRREEAIVRAREIRQDLSRTEERREDREFILTDRAEDREFNREERAADREDSRGLLVDTIPDENRNLRGITRGGQTTDLGIRVAPGSRGDDSGFSAGDKRLWDTVKDRHTISLGLGETTTDWMAVADEFRQMDRPALASLAAPAEGGSVVDMQSDEWVRAEEMANDWAGERAGWFSTDKTDFAEHGGSRTEAKLAKTREFYEQLTDRAGTGDRVPASTSGTSPPGSGTEADPYRATSQAQVDWFKASAPAGSIIEIDGQLYKK
jgi:hypothetical protein